MKEEYSERFEGRRVEIYNNRRVSHKFKNLVEETMKQ